MALRERNLRAMIYVSLSLFHLKLITYLRDECFGFYPDLLLEVLPTAFMGSQRRRVHCTEPFDSLHDPPRADVIMNPHYFSVFLKTDRIGKECQFSFLKLILLGFGLCDSLFEKPDSSQPIRASVCHREGEPRPELGLPLASVFAISAGSRQSATLLILSA